jgi:hypothetical protein
MKQINQFNAKSSLMETLKQIKKKKKENENLVQEALKRKVSLQPVANIQDICNENPMEPEEEKRNEFGILNIHSRNENNQDMNLNLTYPEPCKTVFLDEANDIFRDEDLHYDFRQEIHKNIELLCDKSCRGANLLDKVPVNNYYFTYDTTQNDTEKQNTFDPREETKYLDVIYHVYEETYRNREVTGLGDFIRGCYFLLEYCQHFGCRFEIIIRHPIIRFLEIESNTMDIPMNTFSNIFFYSNDNIKKYRVDTTNNNWSPPLLKNKTDAYNAFTKYLLKESECKKRKQEIHHGETYKREIHDREIYDGEIHDGETYKREIHDGEIHDGEIHDREIHDGETYKREIEREKKTKGNVYCYNILFPYQIENKNLEYMRSLLKPSKYMEQYLNLMYLLLQVEPNKYHVLHIRCGDMYLQNKIKMFPTKYTQKIMNVVENILKKNNREKIKIVLIVDNNLMKYILQKKFPELKTLTKNISHLGEGTALSDETIQNTLLDFYLISTAQKIDCVSVYKHGSGFSYWCALTYGVPYRCLYVPVE